MRIQYASDLHLEYKRNWDYLLEHPIEVMGEVLVLAGDIGYLGDDKTYTSHPFWDWASEHYRQVIVVPGNHGLQLPFGQESRPKTDDIRSSA